jgi:hypothetical protein
MDNKFRILIVATFWFNWANAQCRVEIVINKQVQPAQKFYTVKDDDEVQINFYLNNSFLQPILVDSIQAKTCNFQQNQKQQQSQKAQDATVTIFKKIGDGLSKIGEALSKKRFQGMKTMSFKTSGTLLKFYFHPKEMSSCLDRYFWIKVRTNPIYKQRLASIQNFKEDYKFILVR